MRSLKGGLYVHALMYVLVCTFRHVYVLVCTVCIDVCMQVSPAEVQAILKGLNDPSPFYSNGVKLQGMYVLYVLYALYALYALYVLDVLYVMCVPHALHVLYSPVL